MDPTAFVREQLPQPPARVLEVGCGRGEVALALDAAGWDVTAIDPGAPDGPIFRRLKLEDIDVDESFDAVFAGFSLHHVADLVHALDRIVELLVPGGTLVLDEFAWDLMDETTAAWFHRRRGGSEGLDECVSEWEADHVGLHGFAAMRAELDRRFDERLFVPGPFLYRLLGESVTAEREQRVIDSGDIRALGFRYAGTRNEG